MHFKRQLFEDLLSWKSKAQRQPLLIRGARQIGKSSLVEFFGKTEFSKIHIFNFQKSPELRAGFAASLDPKKIISFLEVRTDCQIDLKKDLIFFDEIQDCDLALNSLKYFAEDMPNAYVIGAGSLLGVYLSGCLSGRSFPVGKVEFLDMYPLSFFEFLQAQGKISLATRLKSINVENNAFHDQFVEELKLFFALGGMPKVLATYLTHQNLDEARKVQEDLVTSYKADFVKYSGAVDALKILTVFENIPKQLAKDNRKFQFNVLKKSSRYNEFATAIDWLSSAGLAYKIPIISHVEVPIKPLISEKTFKLYFFEIGLLGVLAGLPIRTFLKEPDLFKTFKGAFVENYFVQEFRSQRSEDLYCWQGKSSEVDFLYLNKDLDLYPIEVKSGESGKLKSLQVFFDKYPCKWKTRCSLHKIEIREDTRLRTLSLPYACKT